jgi:hypothetical protein
MFESSAEVALPGSIEIIATEIDLRFGPHLIHTKADLLEDLRGGSGGLPKADVASLPDETIDEVLATAGRCQRIGKKKALLPTCL